MTVSFQPPRSTPDIIFVDVDFKGVSPHDNDVVVIFVEMMGFNIQHILVDQDSSANVMYWDAFIGLKVPKDLLSPYLGALVRFVMEEIEVQGYAGLEITFGNEGVKTLTIQYLIVNESPSYNVFLGRPLLNKLEAIVRRRI